jgi:hypothetical protein
MTPKRETIEKINVTPAKELAPNRAFLMSKGDGLWIAFGQDAVSASRTLPVRDSETLSVSGSFDGIAPIDLRRLLWPYFTNNPRVFQSPIEDSDVCYCEMLMDDHHQGSSCTSPRPMPLPPPPEEQPNVTPATEG